MCLHVYHLRHQVRMARSVKRFLVNKIQWRAEESLVIEILQELHQNYNLAYFLQSVTVCYCSPQ